MATQRVVKTEEVQTSTIDTKKVAQYSVVDQFVYLILGIIEFGLLIRFFFRLTGANPGAGVVAFTYNISDILMVPFRFVFPASQVEGAYFEWSVLVAMVFYALFAWIIMKVVAMVYTADNVS